MRVILAGQRSFGAAVYKMLVEEGHDVRQVVAPDGDKLARAARNTGVGHWPYIDVNVVRTLEADLIVAAHSHDFISKAARAATRLGGIGYHPSLLPRHRGRDAVRWTVHMGDAIAGGSVYWLTDHVDGGPIARQDYCFVHPGDDATSLWRRDLFPMGVRLLAQVLRTMDRGVLIEIPQDERVATWEPSFDRPPLFRPDLPQIGPSPNGFHVIASKEHLHSTDPVTGVVQGLGKADPEGMSY